MTKATAESKPKGTAKGRKRRAPPAAEEGGKMIRTLGEMEGHPRNPREIGQVASDGLRSSMWVFGDLAGVVFNASTSHVICAHQRREQLEALDVSKIRWGRPYTVTLGYERHRFESVERDGWVRLPDGARFHIRQVSWPDEDFEKAALLTANNPEIMGDFTDDAAELLEELRLTIPDLTMEQLVLDDLLDELTEGLEDEPDDALDGESGGGSHADISDRYTVVVECESESAQQRLHKRLQGEGLVCHCQVW